MVEIMELERLKQQLAENEANLMKSATIGKGLLEANQELELRCEELIADHAKQTEVLEQEKYSLQLKLTNQEHLERHRASEIESLQASHKQELDEIKTHLEREHAFELQKAKATCDELRSDIELARIQSSQLKEQVKSLEAELESKATVTLNETHSSEEKMSTLEEENIQLNKEKIQLSSSLTSVSAELKQLQFTHHMLSTRYADAEERAEDEHKQRQTYFKNLQETRKQLEELQAELDLLKLESTDPKSKGNSLFAEVEDRRQVLEKKLISFKLQQEALKRDLNYKKQQVLRLNYQIAGFLQMDRGKVEADQVERQDQLLVQSRAEVKTLSEKVKTLTEKLKTLQSREVFDPSVDEQESQEPDKQHLICLKKFYQSKLDQTRKEMEDVKDELQSQISQHICQGDELVECQRKLYTAEVEGQRLKSANVRLTLKLDEYKSKLTELGVIVSKPKQEVYKEKIPIPAQRKTEKALNQKRNAGPAATDPCSSPKKANAPAADTSNTSHPSILKEPNAKTESRGGKSEVHKNFETRGGRSIKNKALCAQNENQNECNQQ